MNIKSLLIGSVAALVAVSGARAADAVVAEPEAVEYVRVCDAYGAGFFYIPGTETCLKIGGYVRYQINYNQNGWAKVTSGNLQVTASSDTEMGTLTSYIELGAATSTNNGVALIPSGAPVTNPSVSGGAFTLNHAWISLGGLKMGFNGDGAYDGGLDGEGTGGGGAGANFIAYTFSGGNGVSATLTLEEETTGINFVPNIVGKVSYSAGTVGVDVWAAYDDNDNSQIAAASDAAWSVKGRVSVAVGDAGSFKLLATYNGSGLTNPVSFLNSNNYANGGRWTIGGSYSHKVSDKLALTGALQYVADTNYELAGKPSAWKAGAVADYTIVPGFAAKLAVTYSKPSGAKGSTGGFLRFQRSF